jgi:hypothetical protein
VPQDFQFPLYLLAAEAAGFNPTELIYYWLAQEDSSGLFKKSSLPIGNDDESLTPDDIQIVQRTIITIVEQICSGNFEANPRKQYECGRCSFDSVCDSEQRNATADE